MQLVPKKTGVIQTILTHLCWSHNLPLPFFLLLLIQLPVFPNLFLSLFCSFLHLASSAHPLLLRPVNYY